MEIVKNTDRVCQERHLHTTRALGARWERAPGAQASELPVPMPRVPEAADTLRAVLSYGYSPRHQAVHEIGIDLAPITKTGEPVASGPLLNPLRGQRPVRAPGAASPQEAGMGDREGCSG